MRGQPMAATGMRAGTLMQAGGMLYQQPAYVGGLPYLAPSPLPSAGATQLIQIGIEGRPIAEIAIRNGEVAARAVAEGLRANVKRRDITTLTLQPSLITS